MTTETNLIAWLLFTTMAASSAQAQLRVVTTTTDLADIARSIGGKHVSVESICQGQRDPHNSIPIGGAPGAPSYVELIDQLVTRIARSLGGH